MNRAETLLRKAVKGALLVPGVASSRRPGDVVILLYHRIGDGPTQIDLPVRDFERQLLMLRDARQVIRIDQIASSPEGGVVVSFDDGTPDFYEKAFPLLCKYEVPAVLYLATSFVSDPDAAGSDTLRWDQLEEVFHSGLVTLGAHTHRHANLLRATADEARHEMMRSKEIIEDKLGTACRHFSYPWAVGSDAADREARKIFETAALRAWKTNRRDQIDLHRLGRVPVLRSDGDLFFRAKVRGRLDSEALVYRLLRRGPWRYR